jgi:hypothetical protein
MFGVDSKADIAEPPSTHSHLPVRPLIPRQTIQAQAVAGVA